MDAELHLIFYVLFDLWKLLKFFVQRFKLPVGTESYRKIRTDEIWRDYFKCLKSKETTLTPSFGVCPDVAGWLSPKRHTLKYNITLLFTT